MKGSGFLVRGSESANFTEKGRRMTLNLDWRKEGKEGGNEGGKEE